MIQVKVGKDCDFVYVEYVYFFYFKEKTLLRNVDNFNCSSIKMFLTNSSFYRHTFNGWLITKFNLKFHYNNNYLKMY